MDGMAGAGLARAPVLLVEDYACLRAVGARVLATAGLDVVPVADGAAALAWLARQPPPALVVLELVLPGVDGWQLLARLRADPLRAAVPVVVYTALAANDPRLAALCDEAVLFKPHDLAAVVEVARWCGGPHRNAASAGR